MIYPEWETTASADDSFYSGIRDDSPWESHVFSNNIQSTQSIRTWNQVVNFVIIRSLSSIVNNNSHDSHNDYQ